MLGRSVSLTAAMYGFNEYYDPFLHGKVVVESRIKEVFGNIDLYDPEFVQHQLGIPIPLSESYGRFSPQFEMMILNEAGFAANFWRRAVSGVEAGVDYLKQKYDDTKDGIKQKAKDFKEATVGLAKSGNAFMQVMWAVTTGGGAQSWLMSLRWHANRIYKFFKNKFEKIKNYVTSFSWLSFLRKPMEWIFDKITWLRDKIYDLKGIKGALMATGAAAGLGMLRKKLEEKLKDLITYVDKALGGAGWDPEKQTAQDGLVQTATKAISEKLKKEIIDKLKDTFVGEIYNWVKSKIKDMMSTAVGSAITGGWKAYSDTLSKVYDGADAVLSAIKPALKRAGGVGLGDQLVGGIHKVKLESFQLTIQNILTEMTVRNIVSLEGTYD